MKVIALLMFLLISTSTEGLANTKMTRPVTDSVQKRLNFYVANKLKSLDLFSRLSILRARIQAKKFKHELVLVVASSSQEAVDKIIEQLEKHDALIGNIWFDSHGRYYNGYSSFILGKDEFSYKTIRDSIQMRHIKRLAAYVDERTRVAVGSCYGGATYHKPANGEKPSTRMNGDSLLRGLGEILQGATVYGAEGFVMMKPGIFRKHSYALSGFPIQKKFLDDVYLPVWENLGEWNAYNATTGNFEKVNSLSLSRNGTIHIKSVTYLDKKKYKKRQQKKIYQILAFASNNK